MKKFRPLNLIIPMAGKGLRFRKNDYKIYKPFIKIDEKCMLEYVTKNFPKSVKIWIITCKAYLSKKQINFLEKKKLIFYLLVLINLDLLIVSLNVKNYFHWMKVFLFHIVI